MHLAEDCGDVIRCRQAIAVTEISRGFDIGQQLTDAAELHARKLGKSVLEWRTRIELVTDHATSLGLDFVEGAYRI